MCDHKLNIFQSLTASGPFKHKCIDCGQLIYREHPRASLPYQVLFVDRMGILFFVLLFLIFPHIPLALAILAGVTTVLYFWDINAEPLIAFTEEEQSKESKRNKLILGAVLVVLAISIWAALSET